MPSFGSRGLARACPDRPSPTGGQRSQPRSSLRARPGYPQGPPSRAASNFLSCLRGESSASPSPAAPPGALPGGARRAGPAGRPTARGLGLGPTPAGLGHDALSTGAAAAPGYTREPGRSRRDTGTRTPQSSAYTPCPPGLTSAHPGRLDRGRFPPGAPPARDPRLSRPAPRGKLRSYSPAAPGRALPPAIAALRRPPSRCLPSRRAAEAVQAAQAEAAAAPGLRCVAASPLPSMNGEPSSARLRTSLDLAACGTPGRAHAPPEAGGRGRGAGQARASGAGRGLQRALCPAPHARPGPPRAFKP